MSKYREQYQRMKRLYRRLQKSESSPVESSDAVFAGAAETLKDDGLAFFQSCLHLRDWIENDESLPQPVRMAARPYVKASRVLSLCGDIAIGAKHLTVDRPLAPGENPRLKPVSIIEKYKTFEDPNRPPDLPAGVRWLLMRVLKQSLRLMLETSSGEIGALPFAGDCIKEWDTFFKLHGLT